MGFAVVTDSTADIASDIAEARGVTVVPLSLTIGGETMPDGTLTQPEFFARMAQQQALPTTSQPSMGAFAEVYERLLQTADEIVSVHISEKLSGTINSATQAAEQFPGRVHVFDSRNLSWGLGWQVLDAAASAAGGLSVVEAIASLERVREATKMIVGIDSLTNLARGGRIGRVGAFLGSILDLKITFTVAADGAFEPVGRSRGEKAALKLTLDWVDKQMAGARAGRFAVGHAMGLERAQWLSEQLRERYQVDELVIYEAGTVIATHTGTGWSVAVVPQR